MEITVTDTVISSEEMPYILNRFYSAEESTSCDRDGPGLGLAIIKAVVEAQGGRVSAASAGINQDSAFSITLGGIK